MPAVYFILFRVYNTLLYFPCSTSFLGGVLKVWQLILLLHLSIIQTTVTSTWSSAAPVNVGSRSGLLFQHSSTICIKGQQQLQLGHILWHLIIQFTQLLLIQISSLQLCSTLGPLPSTSKLLLGLCCIYCVCYVLFTLKQDEYVSFLCCFFMIWFCCMHCYSV